MNSHLISKIRKAVEKDKVDVLLELIHQNMHIEEDKNGHSYVSYHSPQSHEIIEEISAALVEFDAADLFREMCLQGGLEYDLANLPATGDMNILDLARANGAKALAEAILAQDGKSKHAEPAKPGAASKMKAPKKPVEIPQYLKDFHFALKKNFGGVAASGIFEHAKSLAPEERMKRLDAIVTAGLMHAITTIDDDLAYSLLRQAKKSGEVSQSVMQQMASIAGRQAFEFESDTPSHKRLFAIAVRIRNEAKTMGRPADFAAAGIADEVLPENPVIRGVELG